MECSSDFTFEFDVVSLTADISLLAEFFRGLTPGFALDLFKVFDGMRDVGSPDCRNAEQMMN